MWTGNTVKLVTLPGHPDLYLTSLSSVLYLLYKFGTEYLKELTRVSWTLVLTIVYNSTYFIH